MNMYVYLRFIDRNKIRNKVVTLQGLVQRSFKKIFLDLLNFYLFVLKYFINYKLILNI